MQPTDVREKKNGEIEDKELLLVGHHQILESPFNLYSALLKGSHLVSVPGQVVAFRKSPELVIPNPRHHLAHFKQDMPV